MTAAVPSQPRRGKRPPLPDEPLPGSLVEWLMATSQAATTNGPQAASARRSLQIVADLVARALRRARTVAATSPTKSVPTVPA